MNQSLACRKCRTRAPRARQPLQPACAARVPAAPPAPAAGVGGRYAVVRAAGVRSLRERQLQLQPGAVALSAGGRAGATGLDTGPAAALAACAPCALPGVPQGPMPVAGGRKLSGRLLTGSARRRKTRRERRPMQPYTTSPLALFGQPFQYLVPRFPAYPGLQISPRR